MNRSSDRHMPRDVARRIMKRAAESDEAIVVTMRGGKPSRVFGYNEHRKMVELPHRVKPWEHRKERSAPPDPLGAIDARPPRPLTRKSFYEEE
jgi:predicted nucleic acid-binding protein